MLLLFARDDVQITPDLVRFRQEIQTQGLTYRTHRARQARIMAVEQSGAATASSLAALFLIVQLT